MLFLIDIDQCIANNAHRAHLVECPPDQQDWKAFLSPEMVAKDTPIDCARPAIDYLRTICHKYDDIKFITGRNEGLFEVTKEWLKKYFDFDVTVKNLLMRPINSVGRASENKRALMNNLIYDYSHPWIAFDDDPYLSQVYRDFGTIWMKAPEIWPIFCRMPENLSEELAWRK